MSIVVSDWRDINGNPLNNSKTKQHYSFSKGRRFYYIPTDNSNPVVSYIQDGSTFKFQRAQTIAKEIRPSIVQKPQAPPPGTYNSLSSFKILNRTNTSFLMRKQSSAAVEESNMPQSTSLTKISQSKTLFNDESATQIREDSNKMNKSAIAYNQSNLLTLRQENQKNKRIGKTEFPGPGAYTITTGVISRNQRFPAYTIPSRHKQTCLLDGNDPLNPGPGYYQYFAMAKNGKYSNAKYLNSKCPTFGQKTDQLITLKLQQPSIVGPGSYDVGEEKVGKYVSVYKNKGGAIFPTQKRKTFGQISEEKQNLPGPGEYSVPSEFGQYMDKKQFQKIQLKSANKKQRSESQ